MIDIRNIKVGDTVYYVWDGYATSYNEDAVCDCKIRIHKDKIIALVEFKNGLFALPECNNDSPITDCTFCIDDDQRYWYTTKKDAIEKARELAIEHFIVNDIKESEE